MRPGQNRRMRGRNNNRKGPNPLTRSFESNGPDVKIRGTAQHIAEKYAQLARDAQASGDPVASENYLQHAEHYFRIVAAAQAQFPQSYNGGFQRPYDEGADDGDGDEDVNGYGGYGQQPAVHEPGAPQPDIRMQSDDGYAPRQPYRERRTENGRGDYAARAEDERGEDGNRAESDRVENGRSEGGRADAPREGTRRERFRRGSRAAARPQPEADEAGDTGLPAFLTTPVRPAASSEVAGDDEAGFAAPAAEGEEAGRFPLRTRRRRGRPRAERAEGEGSNGAGGEHSGSEAAPVD